MPKTSGAYRVDYISLNFGDSVAATVENEAENDRREAAIAALMDSMDASSGTSVVLSNSCAAAE